MFPESFIFKKTSSINYWKKNLNTCFSCSWRIALQTKTKFQKVLKRTLSCCKIQIVFQNQTNLRNIFRFKDRLSYNLISYVVYKFQCGRCNASYCGETDRHLKVRSREHNVIFPLTFTKKPSPESSIRDHLLFCNHDPSFDDFTILAEGSYKFL